MKRSHWLALLLAVCSCKSSTEPKHSMLATVYDIEVPSTVLATDTLTIRFDYYLGCEGLDHLETLQSSTGITFEVWVTNDGFPCLQFMPASARHVQMVLPPRAAPFTVRFKQTPRDSVLTVSTPPGASAVR